MYKLVNDLAAPPHTTRLAALASEALQYHRSLPSYHPTPLHRLDALAHSLGVGQLLLKDESSRFGLNAFKGLGASFAVHKWLATHPGAGPVTFTTATDGNHGRAVAWAARQVGHPAVIFVPAHAAAARVAAIRAEGAEVVLVEEGYDAAVARAHEAAVQNGWVVIQDGSREGYVEIPEWISAGYWTHAHELEPIPNGDVRTDVDVVILHAGVGTWPAAMVAYFWHRYGAARPRIAVVEPERAPCVLAAVEAGRPVVVETPLRTVMAGLDCAVASASAVETLARGVEAFFTIGDHWALEAMRRLATPMAGDPRVIAGESGAASAAGLMALMADDALSPVREHLQLDSKSRVLVWSTEGATDPLHWQAVVGSPPPVSV